MLNISESLVSNNTSNFQITDSYELCLPLLSDFLFYNYFIHHSRHKGDDDKKTNLNDSIKKMRQKWNEMECEDLQFHLLYTADGQRDFEKNTINRHTM